MQSLQSQAMGQERFGMSTRTVPSHFCCVDVAATVTLTSARRLERRRRSRSVCRSVDVDTSGGQSQSSMKSTLEGMSSEAEV